MNKLTTLMAAMAMLVLSASPLLAGVVKCNSPNVDLQDAIDDAKAGATLDVTGPCDDGPYFIFGKNLNLRGFGGGATLSAPAGSDIVLIIRGATVTLRDLTIDADDTGVGISVEGSSIEVKRVVVEDASAEGLRVDGSSFAIVTNSVFDNDGVGVVITGSSNAFLFGNTMQNNGNVGIVVNLNSSATVQDNDIINNVVGLLVTKMSSAILADNLIENNTGPGILIANQYGYLSTESLPNTIQGNTPDVECQARGIFEAQVTNASATAIISKSPDCTVLGFIF